LSVLFKTTINNDGDAFWRTFVYFLLFIYCFLFIHFSPGNISKQTVGEVENWLVIWYPAVPKIFAPKINTLDNPSLSDNQYCQGCFFRTWCMLAFISEQHLLSMHDHHDYKESCCYYCYHHSLNNAFAAIAFIIHHYILRFLFRWV